MEQNRTHILNEAELRFLVVDLWLRDHGFSPNQVRLESSFTIALGRGLYSVGAKQGDTTDAARARSDYLVRSNDGRNLLVIEAKAPNERLDEGTRVQAISYARLLSEGGIAPFAVVTNGKDTQIFDSVTGEPLNGDSVPSDHPYAINGFRVSGNGFSCRAEALEHLISLSSENLIAFCRAQVENRMALLRSDSIESGLKYIPSLYIPREPQEKELVRLTDGPNRCILVLGAPQVGKTNFICNFVEKQLGEGTPCLFFPAVSMTNGLLEEIRADFEWTFNDCGPTAQEVARRLLRVLEKSQSKLLIFLDGMNENREFVRVFNADVERLQNQQIKIIFSLTSFSARDILLDDLGNPTCVTREIGIRKNELPILEVSPSSLSSSLPVVSLGPFLKEESEFAYAKYCNAFQVKVGPDHQHTASPLLLRSAMEVYRGGMLPSMLDAEEILEKIIDEKLIRTRGLSVAEGKAIITEVAERLCSGTPVTDFWLQAGIDGARGLFESAVLIRKGSRSLDFYITFERSFVIAHWLREWHWSLRDSDESFEREILFASQSSVAGESLRWFLAQSESGDILARIPRALDRMRDYDARKTMVLCLCDYLAVRRPADMFFEVEDDEGREALNELLYGAREGDLLIAPALINMIRDNEEQLEIRKISAIGLAVFAPETCAMLLAELLRTCEISSMPLFLDIFEPGFRRAVEEILESYYNSRDSMCPSRLDYLLNSKEECLDEYARLRDVCLPAIQIFSSTKETAKLEELLQELNPEHEPIGRWVDPRLQMSFAFGNRA